VEAAIFAGGARFDAYATAPRVRAPVLLLWASRDSFPRAIYEGLAARMPDARLVDLDAGHLVPMERPDLVVAHALAFCGLARSGA
jgi:pimeloyl-ACP methyl ester carboxylesterase